MKIPPLSSIFKKRAKTEHINSWQWRPCSQPKTLSFRVYAGAAAFNYSGGLETPESADSFSFPTESDILTRVSLDRLFFDRGDTSPSIAKIRPKVAEKQESRQENLEIKTEEFVSPYGKSVIMAAESDDPYTIFKKSMEEMVESHGMKDWESLEKLLACYLTMNWKGNHGFIIKAFVDSVIQITPSNNCRHHNPKIHSLFI